MPDKEFFTFQEILDMKFDSKLYIIAQPGAGVGLTNGAGPTESRVRPPPQFLGRSGYA